MPNRAKITEAGRYGNFRRGLMWNLSSYYHESDFDAVDKILRRGLEKKLSPQQKRRLETLLLVNEHSRLTFRAMSAKGLKKVRAAVKLLQFRRASKDRLNINWERLFGIEISFGDCTGIKSAELLGGYDDFRQTPLWWVFRTDPENVGEQEKWHELPFPKFSKMAKQKIRTDAPWEKQRHLKDGQFRKMLETSCEIKSYS